MLFSLQQKSYCIGNKIILLYEPFQEEVQAAYQQGKIDFPYWSQVWPAAIALANFLQENRHFIQQKKVLELAAGLGLPSVVAASYAASVVCSDYAPAAVEMMQKTVEFNGLKNVQVQLLDWYRLPEDLSTEVLLLSDVSYDARLFSIQAETIKRFLQNGTIIIISTPQRLIAKEALQPLLPFCIQQEEIEIHHHGKSVWTSVMVLKQ